MSTSELRPSWLAPSTMVLVTLALLVLWLGRGHGLPRQGTVEALSVENFHTRLDAMVVAGDTGRRIDNLPIVRVAQGEIYMVARRWQFYPALRLAPGQAYRLHLLADDVVHSAVVAGHEVLLVPGTPQTITLTAPTDGRIPIQCGEYCGLGHSKMTGDIEAVAQAEGMRNPQSSEIMPR